MTPCSKVPKWRQLLVISRNTLLRYIKSSISMSIRRKAFSFGAFAIDVATRSLRFTATESFYEILY